MITLSNSTPNPKQHFVQAIQRTKLSSLGCRCNSLRNPKYSFPGSSEFVEQNTHLLKPFINPNQAPKPLVVHPSRSNRNNYKSHSSQACEKGVLFLCGFGYWVAGFRCFPWLALNFHMAQGLSLHPAALQLVQYSANLPMVAKPLYGLLSDALYIGDAHRLPYISLGVFIQVISWGTMALIPVTGTFPAQMACILLSNFGASITEVASDALVAEFGKRHKLGELQSYSFMALATGGILGNLFGGFLLQRTRQPKVMFLIFSILLLFQLATSFTIKETSLHLSQSPSYLVRKSISDNLSKQFYALTTAINEESISHPLYWVVASIAVVPILSGTTFCYQTRCLKLDPSIIGMSKVIGQLMVLSATAFYSRFLKRIPMRKLICGVQITYALSILSDWFLIKQYNMKLGISNEAYVLSLSSLAEAASQFKLLPFSILFANLSPHGCEGSLIAFLSSALCLSSIFSGFLGVGLASLVGISSEDYSNLPVGILTQFLAALLPLWWISHVPMSETVRKGKKRSKTKRLLSLPGNYQQKSVKHEYRGKSS